MALWPVVLFGQYVDKAPDGYFFVLQDIEVTVHENRTYDIQEHLLTYFTEQSHGLYRSIPTRFWVSRDVSALQDSSQWEMRYNSVKISNLNVSEPFQPESGDNLLDVRIGSPDVFVNGPHAYDISYTLTLPDDRVAYADLFFHSIVGTGWTCATDSVHFTVHFDKEVPETSLAQLTVLAGAEGNDTDCARSVITYRDSHTLKGSIRDLKPYEGLTLNMPLPEGYFLAGSTPVWVYLSWAAAIITLLLLIRTVLLEMQTEAPVPTVVTFHPIKGLTSADMGSLVDGSVDDIDLLSIIPWFASEGYLAIERRGDDIYLNKLRPLPEDAPQYQQILFNEAFFHGGNTTFQVKSSAAFGTKWEKAKDALTKSYDGKLDEYAGRQKPLLWAMFTFALLVFFNQVEPDAWVTGGVVHVFSLLLFAFYPSVKSQFQSLSFNGCANLVASLFSGCVMSAIVLVFAGLILVAPGMYSDTYIPSSVPTTLSWLLLATIVFSPRLLRYTAFRRERLGEVRGLQEFIRTAEQDRLRMLLDRDETYFYRILPYAVAFGMVDEWAAKFKDLTVQPTNGYYNTDVSHISRLVAPSHYMSHVHKSVSAATAARSSSGGSRSSGSHRGGYSGGGSGGGGGRRW